MVAGHVVSAYIDPNINPFMPNDISHRYQLEQSIYVFKGCWMVFFHFHSNFNRTFCKQIVETLIGRRVLWRLIWVCTICLCLTKKTFGLYGYTDSMLCQLHMSYCFSISIFCGRVPWLYQYWPGGFMLLWFYVQELPKTQPAAVLVLKRLIRRGNGLKSHPTDWEKPGIEPATPGL